MRKLLILLISAAFLAASCSKHNMERPDTAAEAYYDMLINGEYDDFVAGIAYADSMTDDYRSQFARLIAQHSAEQQLLHGGYVSARAVRDTTFGNMAEVFLEITFADSTCEEIALPMLRCGKIWKMQ